MNQIEPLLTPKEIATILQLGKNRVYSMLRSGELPSIRVCGSRKLTLRVRPSDLDKWIRLRKIANAGPVFRRGMISDNFPL